MLNGYEREFVYAYGAVSPLQGTLDWRLCREMNTQRMSEFLRQVSQAHSRDFPLMILDGASSHKARELEVPENMRLLALPPYAPELNPQEHIWDERVNSGPVRPASRQRLIMSPVPVPMRSMYWVR